MARKRVIDPQFWLDEEISQISAAARLLYIGLWGICDDRNATLPNRPLWIKTQIFPYEIIDIDKLLKELADIGKIILFKDQDTKDYWYIKNFTKWQKVDHPSDTKYPKYRGAREPSESPRSELSNLININKGDNLIKTSREQLKEKWGKNGK